MSILKRKATTVMKTKQKTEDNLYYISTFAWGIVTFVMGCLFLFGIGIISLENWPF